MWWKVDVPTTSRRQRQKNRSVHFVSFRFGISANISWSAAENETKREEDGRSGSCMAKTEASNTLTHSKPKTSNTISS